MARGMAAGEAITSQAATEDYRAGHDRTFGERKPGQRGRWIWDAEAGRLVRAEDYRAPAVKCGTGIIADRAHEGTTFHDGERVRDLGSRSKRRAFLRETGLAEASDYSTSYREAAAQQRERAADRRIEASAEQAARKLYQTGKWKE
jgi:hypothetical protein